MRAGQVARCLPLGGTPRLTPAALQVRQALVTAAELKSLKPGRVGYTPCLPCCLAILLLALPVFQQRPTIYLSVSPHPANPRQPPPPSASAHVCIFLPMTLTLCACVCTCACHCHCDANCHFHRRCTHAAAACSCYPHVTSSWPGRRVRAAAAARAGDMGLG